VKVLVDTTPLRVCPDFRRLWIGQAVSFLGTQMSAAAVPFQVYRLTHSSLDVGLLGLVQLGPLLVAAVVGGAAADGHDKRRLLLVVTVASMLCSAGLLANSSLGHPQLWLLYLLGAASSATGAFLSPILRSLATLVLPGELRAAGFALQAGYGSFGMTAGPAVAGVLIATLGFPSLYLFDAVSYLAALAAFLRVAPAPPVPGAERSSPSSVLTGLRFLRGSLVAHVFALDLVAMVFGMPRALFPALVHRLGGGAELYGLLTASVAAGAFVASVLSGWAGKVRRQGQALLLAVATWGATIAVVGVVRSAVLAVVFLAGAGAADMISGVYRYTITAEVTPDHLRGRVSGAELAVYAGGPSLGDLESGVVGGVWGVPVAIVSGGLACIVGAGLFAIFVPRLGRYRTSASGAEVPAPA
jgi:MFS family permease